MKWRDASRGFRIYLAVLWLAWLIVAAVSIQTSHFKYAWVTWLVLSVLLALSEFVALSFHGQSVRFSLSAAEAILLPMVMTLSFGQLVLGATLANAVARPNRWRLSPLQEFFNVAQYGCAAAAAGATWARISDPSSVFTLHNAGVAALAVVVFAAVSHLLVAIAVSFAKGSKLLEFLRAIDLPSFVLNLAGNISLGLLFAAAYFASAWTIVLFGLPLVALYFGYRAVLRQNRERQRVEQLHAASRALASSPDLGGSIQGFLAAVSDIQSATGALTVVPLRGELFCSATRNGQVVYDMAALPDGWVSRIFSELTETKGSLVLGKDETEAEQARDPHVPQTLLAVPLWDQDEVIGCVMAMDRIGPEGFTEADARLLDALAAELALSLDSYRLFAQVAEERERFARIFNGSKEGICLIDGEGVVRAWNPALERITGYAAADVMGVRWSDRVMVRAAEQKRVEGSELVSLASDDVVEVVTRDGPTRWVSVVSGPVQSEGESGGWVVLMRDMTAEHEVEAAKSDFLSTISHELRTPLTTIKGSLQVLGRGTANLPPELTEQMIGVTTRGAERLERLVMNLLMVSQIESGAMPVFTEEISMPDVVRERVGSFLRDHAKVELELEDKEIHVRADRERLSQVVEHLLDNAVKFGGPQGEISVALRRSNGYAHLSVSDEGPGVSPADHERIFERFIRLGDVLTRETQGAGVGLFIAKSAVDAMDGRIWVESEPGKGSTFHVEIPLARPSAVHSASA